MSLELLLALRALDAHPQVRAAQAQLRQASTRLRWQEVLRRRWQEARTETAVRSAIASAAIDGMVCESARLRTAIAQGALGQHSADTALNYVAGIWRAQVRLNAWMPPLRGASAPTTPPANALLATLHRDLTAPLVAAGVLSAAQVALPRRPGALPLEQLPVAPATGAAATARLQLLRTLIQMQPAPALVRAAVVHAEILCLCPFSVSNGALGRLLVRHLSSRDGLEPTGVAVIDYYASQSPAEYVQALTAYANGSEAGVIGWVLWQARALLVGIEQGMKICRAVQAGTVQGFNDAN